jgi:hypothetical protein
LLQTRGSSQRKKSAEWPSCTSDFDRDTQHLPPPSIQDYLAEDHLARFVVEIVDRQRDALDVKPGAATANTATGFPAVRHDNMIASLRVLSGT